MKKAFVISALLVVLTLSLGGSAVSKGTDSGATIRRSLCVHVSQTCGPVREQPRQCCGRSRSSTPRR